MVATTSDTEPQRGPRDDVLGCGGNTAAKGRPEPSVQPPSSSLKNWPGWDLLNPGPSSSRAPAAGVVVRSPKSWRMVQVTALSPKMSPVPQGQGQAPLVRAERQPEEQRGHDGITPQSSSLAAGSLPGRVSPCPLPKGHGAELLPAPPAAGRARCSGPAGSSGPPRSGRAGPRGGSGAEQGAEQFSSSVSRASGADN